MSESTSSDVPESWHPIAGRPGRWRGWITAGLIVGWVAATAAVLNWPYRYARWYLLDHGAVTPAPRDGSLDMVRGGFPLTYLTRYYPPDTFTGPAAKPIDPIGLTEPNEPVEAQESTGVVPGVDVPVGGADVPIGGGEGVIGGTRGDAREVRWVRQEWRPAALGCNLLFWSFAAALGGWTVVGRSAGSVAEPRRVAGGPRPWRWGAYAAPAVVMAIPASAVGFQAWSRYRETVAQRTSGVILVDRCARVPAVLGANLPRGWMRLLERVESFQLRRGRSVDGSLTRFGSVGSLAMSPNQLIDAVAAGVDLRGVHDLTLLAGPIGADVARVLDDNPQLVHLSLVSCAVDPDGWAAVQRLPTLRRLRIPRTRLPVADPMIDLASRQSLREILISLVPGGPSWTFADLPQLDFVQIDAAVFGRQMPPVVFRDLPQMTRLLVDPRPRYDVTFVRCPRFRSVGPAIYGPENGTPPVTGSAVRLTQVTLEDCDSVVDWTVPLGDTRSFRVRGCDGLSSLTAGAMVLGQLGSINLVDVDRQRIEGLWETVDACDRLRDLAVYGVPMDEDRLRRLAKLPQLESLSLRQCRLSFDALDGLKEASKLRQLQLGYTPGLTLRRLDRLTAGRTRLEELSVDLRDLDRLDWRPPRSLRSVRTGPVLAPETVRLRGIDDLETSLHIVGRPRTFELGDASRLTGLALERPLPAGASIGRLRDLRFCCLGGEQVDETWFDRVIVCPGLERVVLAYPAVPASRLGDLAGLGNLRSLSVPGWGGDDDDFAALTRRTGFWSMNLSDNRIDRSLIPWLSRCEGLRYLALDRVPLSRDVRRRLGTLRQVSHLSLRGVSISAQEFGHLIDAGQLEYLDCSDTELTENHLERLSELRSPRTLVARNVSGLDPMDWVRVLDRRPDLRVDLGDQTTEVLRAAEGRPNSTVPARVRDDLVRHSLHHVRHENQIAAFRRSLNDSKALSDRGPLDWVFTGDDVYAGDVRPFRGTAAASRTVAAATVD